eukprot:gene30635-39908_t
MACRNLTKKFIDIRNAAKANRSLRANDDRDSSDESGPLRQGEDSSNWKAVKNSLPPKWVESIERVEEDISKIQLKIKDLGILHSKRLMVNFEDDEAQQERDIDAKTREITEVFHHAEGILKVFGQKADDKSLSGAERSLRKNMQTQMAKKLQGLSISFRKSQKDYMNRIKEQKSGSGAQAFDFLDTKNVDFEGDSGFTTKQLRATENIEALVNERDEEIVRIAKSIEELAAIFKELAVLVIDQGTILDRIDYNMEHAVENAKQGVVQLEQAEESQKKAMSVRCIIVLVVLIVILLGVLIWKHSPSSSSSKN